MTAPPTKPLRLAEALVFASGRRRSAPRPLVAAAAGELDADTVHRGPARALRRARVELVEVGGGVQFRTAPDLAPRLRKVIEIPRRLPRVAMETLAIIAYHQPVTRAEIEEIRGASLSQQTLDALLEADLVAPEGPQAKVPGRPTLWGTTPHFLAQFGLQGPARTAAARGSAAGAARAASRPRPTPPPRRSCRERLLRTLTRPGESGRSRR